MANPANEPTFIGRVFVFGLDGTFLWTGVTATQNEPQKLTFKDDVSRHNSKDKKGETIGVQLYDPNPKITLTCLPCDVAGAGKILAVKTAVILPAKGAKVTTKGFPPADPTGGQTEDFLNSVNWLYFGGAELEFTPEGELQITMTVEKFRTDIGATPNT